MSVIAGNDCKLARAKNINYKKLQSSGFKNNELSHNPENVVHKYSSYGLSDVEKRMLLRGSNYALPPPKLNYGEIILHLSRYFFIILHLCNYVVIS